MIKLNFDLLLSILFFILFIPLFIFVIFWLNIYASIVIGTLMMYFLIQYILKGKYTEFIELKYENFILLLVINGYIIYCCGIGGFTEQKFDLNLRSNLVWSHLILHDWPVVINHNFSIYDHFSYYLGYFLPISLFVKSFGLINSISFFEFFWVLLILQTTTLILFTKERLSFKLYLILLPNGLFWLIDQFLLNNSVPIRFFSFFTNLAHGPQQVLCSLILIIFFQQMKKNKDYTWMFFICALSFFWSPFVTFGIGIIYVLPVLSKIKILSFLNLFSVSIGLVMILYYSNKNLNYHFSILSNPASFHRYFLFWLIDLVLLPLVFWKSFVGDSKKQFIYIIGVLALISLINFGKYNDLMTKSAVPILLIYYLNIVKQIPSNKIVLFSLIIFLFSLSSLKLSLNYQFRRIDNYKIIESFKDKTFSDLVNDPVINSQYYSNKNSLYNRYLSRK
jgi:hypothetical protein